jgi:hypothetical protein
MPANYGQSIRFNRARQSAIGAAPAANTYRAMRIFSSTLEGKTDYDPIPVLGGALANDFDTPELGTQMEMVDGEVVFPACLNQIGEVLADLFGAPVTTGASAPFTHTFVSGAASAPLLVAAEMVISASRQRRFAALRPTGMKLDISKEKSGDTTQRISVGYMGVGETTEATALAGIQAERLWLPASGRRARLLINGVANPDVIGASLDYQTGVADIPYLDGNDTIGAIERENDGTASGTFRVRANTNTYHTLSEGGAINTIGFQWQNGTASLTITVNCRIGKRGLPVPGRGALPAEFPFTGQQTNSLPMVTVALVNGIAASQYA